MQQRAEIYSSKKNMKILPNRNLPLRYWIYLTLVALGLTLLAMRHRRRDGAPLDWNAENKQKRIGLNMKSAPDCSARSPADASAIFRDFLDSFRRRRVRLILTETSDLLSPSSVSTRMTNGSTIVSRFGVFDEDLDKLEAAIDEFRRCDRDRPTRIFKNLEDDRIVNYQIVVSLPFRQVDIIEDLPYFPWKKLHLRIYSLRGKQGSEYRWTGEEQDYDGNFNLPAEAFDSFELRPATPTESLFYLPEDPELFAWRKTSAEFKSCVRKSSCSRRKCQTMTKERDIESYMEGIVAVRSLMADLRVHSFLNCGTLLGWYRQCSLIPNDWDVDVLHWSSVDLYPEILRRIKSQPEKFKLNVARLDYGPGQSGPGRQDGFYINLNVNGGKYIDVYFNYRRKVYDTRHHPGTVDKLDFTVDICSADLHGRLVNVPCSDEKIIQILRMDYGEDYMF